MIPPAPETEKLARMRLAAAPFMRADTVRALIDAFGGAEAALRQDAGALCTTGLIGRGPAERFLAAARAFPAEDRLRACERDGIRVLLVPEDPEVPDLLKSIPDAPILLSGLGSLLPGTGRGTLAVVGSRKPTPYGARMARRFGAQAAEAGLVTVSGLARGVDTEAHAAALEAGGIAWAVLGSGLARIYPGENAPLARRIAERGGAVLSELPPDAEPLSENFPRRNRIVSGLASAIVVVEGTETSGSLITAKLAAEQGRDVFAVPGPADSDLSRGPHILIKEGAGLVASVADIIDALPRLASITRRTSGGSATEHNDILALLKGEPRTLDQLSEGLHREVRDLSRELVELEMRGLVVALGSQRYALK